MKDSAIDLSIIIVSYNEANYLSYALESCLSQKGDYKYEVIIGDDGSNDGSIDIIEQYRINNPQIISYYIMDRNDNVSIASIRVSNLLKKAFGIAKGRYITVISGDDFFINDNRMKMQISFLNSNKNYYSIYTDYKLVWDNGKEIPRKMKASLNRCVFWGSNYMHISCFMFRRECLNSLLNVFCDDQGLIYSILKSGNSKHVSMMGFGYRQRGDSIMHKADRMVLNVMEILLMQDCLEGMKMKRGTLAKGAEPLNYVFIHRRELKDERFEKYFMTKFKKENDYLNDIKAYDDLPLNRKIMYILLIIKANIYRYVFLLVRKANILVNIIFENKVKWRGEYDL